MTEAVLEIMREQGMSPLTESDTFQFSCKRCGKCCRNRQSPIVIAGYDIYNICKALGRNAQTVLSRYTFCYLGSHSKLPVVVIKERPDGLCPFMIGKSCSIQKDKPLVCRLYPIGRVFDGNEQIFFLGNGQCPGKKVTTTLKEWLDHFHIHDFDAESLLWQQTLLACAFYTAKYLDADDKKATLTAFQNLFYEQFYLYVDTAKSYLDCLHSAIQVLESRFPDFSVNRLLQEQQEDIASL